MKVESTARRALTLGLLAICAFVPVAWSSPCHAAMNVVLGDSNSEWSPPDKSATSWPRLLFDEDYTDRAFGGASTYHRANDCTEERCWWTENTGVEDVWWIMLGTNDLTDEPETTAEDYMSNMLEIIGLIPAMDIHERLGVDEQDGSTESTESTGALGWHRTIVRGRPLGS